MKTLLTLTILFTVSCGFFKTEEATSKKHIPELEKLSQRYCELSKPMFEKYGQTTDPYCDAALFTSLHGMGCNYVNPFVFELEDSGRMCRRPGCSCYDPDKTKNGADSTFSKDMATGLQLYFSSHDDKGLADRIQMYGIENNWVVCEADSQTTKLSKCLMSSKIIYRWAEIEKKWNGKSLHIDGLNLTELTDFPAHLHTVGIMTEWNLYGKISGNSKQFIKDQVKRDPHNLLFQAMNAAFVTGKREEVAEMLLKRYPNDRLPTTADWCTDYPMQRDYKRDGKINADHLPCVKKGKQPKPHAGTGLILANWVLQNIYK